MTTPMDPAQIEVPATHEGASEPAAMSGPAGSAWDFFRTAEGTILRVEEDHEGALRVDRLKEGVWSQAPRGMIGLRLSSSSRRLTAAEILALPLANVSAPDPHFGLSR